MGPDASFSEVLELLEANGWEFTRFDRPYRVFTKPGRLPIMVRVINKKVDAGDFAKIQSILEREDGAAPSGD